MNCEDSPDELNFATPDAHRARSQATVAPMLILAAALGLVGLLCRRSLWRAVMRGSLFLILLTVGVIVAIVMAGPHWPWIAVATVLLVAAGLTWKVFRWARAVHAVRIARVVWFGWQFVVDIWDARAVARASRPLPPRSM